MSTGRRAGPRDGWMGAAVFDLFSAKSGAGPRTARFSGQKANAISNPAARATAEPNDRRMRNLLRFRRAIVVK